MSQRVDGRRWPGPSLAASVLSHAFSRSLLISLFMRDNDTAIVGDAIPVGAQLGRWLLPGGDLPAAEPAGAAGPRSGQTPGPGA